MFKSHTPRAPLAVVFVHGLIGDYKETWGQFPKLLAEDPDIHVDVYVWGYPSGLFGSQPSVALVGAQLKSTLATTLNDYKSVIFVGHSLGGLVVQKMVVEALSSGRADDLRRIRHIFLFGTPSEGAELAAILKLIDQQAYDVLFSASEIDSLRTEWINRVYSPTIRPGDRNSKLHIPVTPVIGMEDTVVSDRSVRGFYRTPEPRVVPGDHTTMKMPHSRSSSSYQVVKEGITHPRVTVDAPRLKSTFYDGLVHVGPIGGRADNVVQVRLWITNISDFMALDIELDLWVDDGSRQFSYRKDWFEPTNAPPPYKDRLTKTDAPWTWAPLPSVLVNAYEQYRSGEKQFRVKLEATWRDSSGYVYRLVHFARLVHVVPSEGFAGGFRLRSEWSYTSLDDPDEVERRWGPRF